MLYIKDFQVGFTLKRVGNWSLILFASGAFISELAREHLEE
jgi:hypothetical protein